MYLDYSEVFPFTARSHWIKVWPGSCLHWSEWSSTLPASIQIKQGKHFHAACSDLWPHGPPRLEATVLGQSSSGVAELRRGKMLKACLG